MRAVRLLPLLNLPANAHRDFCMKVSCIYCGKYEARERDHVPPKCLFPKPRPSDLITVPSCSACNRTFGRDDERVRNILTSLNTTERHHAVVGQLSGKRDRALSRKKSACAVKHLVESIKIVDVRTPQGIYLGTARAFDLDQEPMDRFLSRLTRALLYYENSIGYVDCTIEWRMPPNPKKWAELNRKYKHLLSLGARRSIGGDSFTYFGYFVPKRAASLWIMNFYGGVEFMSLVRETKEDAI